MGRVGLGQLAAARARLLGPASAQWIGAARRIGPRLREAGNRLVPARARRAAAVLMVGIVGVVLGVDVAGNSTSEIGPFQIDFSLEPSWTGDSQLQIPPLGSIRVDSHDGPAKVVGRIRLLDEKRTRQLINDPAQIEAATDAAANDVRDAIVWLGVRASLAAVLGAGLLGLAVFRSVRRTALTAGVGIGVVLVTVATGAATWNAASIREPHYEGLLANVPAAIGDARSIYDRYGEYRGELIRIVTNLSRTYTNLSTLPVYQPDPNTVRVLHVSDLHLHPSSYEVIGAIVDQFHVNVVADTGDLTHWGTEVENQYAQNIGKLGVPYVFIRGNHDSARTAAAVAAQPNAVVLDNSVREVNGLAFAGISDPRFTADKTAGDIGADGNGDEVLASGRRLADTVREYNATHPADTPQLSPTATASPLPTTSPAPTPTGTAPTPTGTPPANAGTPPANAGTAPETAVDLMMVHDPRAAEPLAGVGPLVLAGHTHERKISQLDDDTTLMVEGSTGANAFRGIGAVKPSPLRMTLLYFSPSGVLQAYDEITVSGAGQSKVELERKILKPR